MPKSPTVAELKEYRKLRTKVYDNLRKRNERLKDIAPNYDVEISGGMLPADPTEGKGFRKNLERARRLAKVENGKTINLNRAMRITMTDVTGEKKLIASGAKGFETIRQLASRLRRVNRSTTRYDKDFFEIHERAKQWLEDNDPATLANIRPKITETTTYNIHANSIRGARKLFNISPAYYNRFNKWGLSTRDIQYFNAVIKVLPRHLDDDQLETIMTLINSMDTVDAVKRLITFERAYFQTALDRVIFFDSLGLGSVKKWQDRLYRALLAYLSA